MIWHDDYAKENMPLGGEMESSNFKQMKERDDLLYQKYAKHLEKNHRGEFEAIGLRGEILISKNRLQLLKQAIERFGSGNFALRKIGFSYVLKWR